MSQPPSAPSPIALDEAPKDYADWLSALKSHIHLAQQRASLAVNRELVLLYWHIGRDILERQNRQGWGSKIIDRLTHDLRIAFPGMKGFSPRNLKYMRAFAQAWPDARFVQEVLAQLPWYHQLALLDKLPTPQARQWYAAKAIEDNWSRNVLVMQIETRLMERSGQAVTNFDARLPPPQKDSPSMQTGMTHGAAITDSDAFHLASPDIRQFATHCVANLSWMHIRTIMRFNDAKERLYETP